VATLAWNTHRHIEAWFGIAGAGAVYHTLKSPSLSRSDRLDHQSWRGADADVRCLLRALVEQIASQLKHVETYVALGDIPPKTQAAGKTRRL